MTAPAIPVALVGVGVGLQTLMTAVLDNLNINLADTVGGSVSRSVMAPGGIVPADACCPERDDELGGQAHVRLSRMYPTIRFPSPDLTWSKFPSQLALELEIGVYRCVAGLDSEACPPAADLVTGDAVRALDDLAALYQTALGTFPGKPVVIGSTAALGPSGYCAGSVLLFTIMFNPACPPGIP